MQMYQPQLFNLGSAEPRCGSTDQNTAVNHGTSQAYRLGCRCEKCKYAKRQERLTLGKPRSCVVCGTSFIYAHGQTGQHRCQECQEPYRLAHRDYVERKSKPRTCHRCGLQYIYTSQSGHGTKYCENCLIRPPWNTNKKKPAKNCAACGIAHWEQNKWELCADCKATLPQGIWDSLLRHRATIGFALYVGSLLMCEICGKDVTTARKDRKGRLRLDYAIDHDHECCPGPHSCGECIRGILCKNCNIGIGYFKNSHDAARNAYHYLMRTERPEI